MSESQSDSTQSTGADRPAPRRESNPLVAAARVLVLIGGLCLIALGLLAGGIGLLAGFLEPDDRLVLVTVVASTMTLTLGLGSALAWQAFNSIQGRGSHWFRPRLVGIWVIVFLLAVLIGQTILVSDWKPALSFPAFHILASVLPPLIIVAWVAHGLGRAARSRDVVLQLGSGALVATVLAFSMEMVMVIGLLAIILAGVAIQPGGLEQIQALAGRLQDAAWLEEPGNLSALAQSPLVIVSAFLVFAVAVPLIEELVKTVGVPLRAYRRPSMAQALVWGLAGGAGFALAEGLFNSLGGLESWAMIVSFRVGATLLHCFTGALMGLAWYQALVQKRWSWALGLYALSAGTHGLWNALVATTALTSLGRQPSETVGLGTAVPFALLALLALAVAMGLLLLTQLVRSHDPASPLEAQAVPLAEATAPTADISGE